MRTETGKCQKCDKPYFNLQEFLEHECLNKRIENMFCNNCGNQTIYQTTRLKINYCPRCMSSGSWILKSEEKQ